MLGAKLLPVSSNVRHISMGFDQDSRKKARTRPPFAIMPGIVASIWRLAASAVRKSGPARLSNRAA